MTQHVRDTIDGAVRDRMVHQDAMRWVPDVDAPRVDVAPARDEVTPA